MCFFCFFSPLLWLPALSPVDGLGGWATAAAQNAPLFLKVFKDAAGSLPRQTDDVVRMQMHEVVYNSLDVVEERRTLGGTPATLR